MSLRIRPEEIEVPLDDPFKYDLLDRRKPAQVLTDVVGSFHGPGVVALDAAWGAGKTTFLRMWSRKLKNDGFAVVEFNAWDTDFAADPFLALSTEIQAGLESSGVNVPPDAMQKVKKWSAEILRHGVPELVRLAGASLPFAALISDRFAAYLLTRLTESRVSGYTKTKSAFYEFRNGLSRVAEAVSQSSDARPVVVIVDELDRCRPTYAVELLETAKHLFSVDHVVFVLGINRSQIAHSVRALYGSEFDADHYLNRFIDASVRLPSTDRLTLIESAIKSAGIYDALDSLEDAAAFEYMRTSFSTLRELFRISDVDVRTTLSHIRRLGIVLASIPERQRSIIWTSTVATLLMSHDENVYRGLCRAEVSDREAIDAVRTRCQTSDWTKTHETRYFEEFVIRLVKDQSDGAKSDPRQRQASEYGALLAPLGGDPPKTDEEKTRPSHTWLCEGGRGARRRWFQDANSDGFRVRCGSVRPSLRKRTVRMIATARRGEVSRGAPVRLNLSAIDSIGYTARRVYTLSGSRHGGVTSMSMTIARRRSSAVISARRRSRISSGVAGLLPSGTLAVISGPNHSTR